MNDEVRCGVGGKLVTEDMNYVNYSRDVPKKSELPLNTPCGISMLDIVTDCY